MLPITIPVEDSIEVFDETQVEQVLDKLVLHTDVNGHSALMPADQADRQMFGSESAANLVIDETKAFGNITVTLYSLGSSAYRIEWFSRMTGAAVSLARLTKGKYTVIRKWAQNRRMPDISSEFDNRKQALIHFLNNVDVIKAGDGIVDAAKAMCLNLFTRQEGLEPIQKRTFTRLRLQGAIGKKVEVKGQISKGEVVAKGTLMQIHGDKAEVRIEERISLNNPSEFIKFPMNRVYII